MNQVVVIATVLTWLGMGNIVDAKELLPWQIEQISIASLGVQSLRIDDRVLSFEVPAGLPTIAFRASEVITRGDTYADWLKKNGEYTKDCFGQSWNFYPLGIPLFGSYAQSFILAQLYVKTSPANRDSPRLRDIPRPSGYLPWNADRGDFSRPEELRTNMERRQGSDKSHITPVEEVIINKRKWYRYFWNTSGYPDDLREVYVTGLAPDRYLEITIRQYPVPVTATRYPTYPAEDQRPGWMKKTHKYREQVINSLRITKPEGSKEADLYEVDAQ